MGFPKKYEMFEKPLKFLSAFLKENKGNGPKKSLF
jgi:hypothetical protein